MAGSLDLRRTPLFERHKAAGARLIDFGGWEMPVQYSGILDEHAAVRNAVGLFDVSHMGEIVFEGRGASAAVQRLITNDLGKLQDGVISFSAVTTRVEDLFRQLPAMLDSLATLQNRQRESIEAFDEQVAARLQEAQKLDDAFKETIRNFGQMPQRLAGDFKEVFTGLGNEALGAWDNYSGEYTKNLQTVYQSFLNSVNGSAGEVDLPTVARR